MRISNIFTVLASFVLVVNADRLVRFISTDDKEYYGDAILPQNSTDSAHSTRARVIRGDILGTYVVTNGIKVGPKSHSCFCSLLTKTQTIKTLLSPLPMERVRAVRCVGLNYIAHINEVLFPKVSFLPCSCIRTIVDQSNYSFIPYPVLQTPHRLEHSIRSDTRQRGIPNARELYLHNGL